jgi:ATP-dependent Lon protease
MVAAVRIYVEGGGNTRATRSRLREGFYGFFTMLRELARQRRIRWDVIPSGSRKDAFDDFTTALRLHPDSWIVLLVDSEETVSTLPRDDLKKRDGWDLAVAAEDQVHLMAQTMEAWLLADPDTLAEYYGVEKFVVTPELQSEDSIGSDPLPPGQIWTISPGGLDENAGLYRIEVTEGPGSGVKILNRPAPAPFSESVRYAEQNLYSRAKQLTGDRDPRAHEFSVQLRAFDASKSGNATGLAVLVALCSALLQKSTKGGLVVIGGLNLGGSIDPVHNAVNVAELAIEKGATTVLVPVTARKQLNDLPDDLITKVNILYYTDAREALLKAIVE